MARRRVLTLLYTSVAPIPFATMTNKEWGNIGNNYLKGLFDLAFQGFFMLVCVGIYSVLVNAMTISTNLHFLQLEPELNQEEVAYRIGDQYFSIQVATEGYDYSFYDKEYKIMDGGILDDPDISMRQAIQNILEDEGLEQLERIPVDYDELQEKAEEVETEILQEARSQRKRVPVISDHTEAEAGLNGMSRSEIEETVWAIAQAEIIENDLDARIQAVRVYGSRTRDGLYKEDSDVDVVIAYEGTVREDDLFSVLNEAGYKTGNMKVDMNPIRPDKTGTLEDFLEKSERYLDEKTEQMKASEEYKPLAKVEELEEANYNMIDNVLNNMPPKNDIVNIG